MFKRFKPFEVWQSVSGYQWIWSHFQTHLHNSLLAMPFIYFVPWAHKLWKLDVMVCSSRAFFVELRKHAKQHHHSSKAGPRKCLVHKPHGRQQTMRSDEIWKRWEFKMSQPKCRRVDIFPESSWSTSTASQLKLQLQQANLISSASAAKITQTDSNRLWYFWSIEPELSELCTFWQLAAKMPSAPLDADMIRKLVTSDCTKQVSPMPYLHQGLCC